MDKIIKAIFSAPIAPRLVGWFDTRKPNLSTHVALRCPDSTYG